MTSKLKRDVDLTNVSATQWIGALVPTLQNQFPMIKAVVWFDVDKERHWEIDSSPASLAAYVKFAADPYMNP